MVLQLVLPQGTVEQQSGHRFTREYPPYALSTTGRKAGLGSQQDLLTSGPRSLPRQLSYTNHAFYESFSDLRDHSFREKEKDQKFGAPSSLGTSSDEDTVSPPPSSDSEKRKMFRGYLTTILSCIYAVFIVTLGLVIYISDIIHENSPLAESFSIYLVVLSLCYFLFLYIDIRRYLKNVKVTEIHSQSQDDAMLKDDMEFKESPEGDLHLSISLPQKVWKRQRSTGPETTPHMYCFSQGRHSGSFYLKIGAAVFCFGHLIHSGLLLGYQIVFLTSETDDFYNCASVPTLVLDILYPLFSFFQLYFIFKYSNVIINRCKELGKFALMHCIASSLCFWVWTILRETMDLLYAHASKKENEQQKGNDEDKDSLEEAVALPLTSYQRRGAEELLLVFNTTPVLPDNCRAPGDKSLIYENYSPYLYPFTIEYSILIVGILYIIWQNIGKCSGETGGHCALPVSPEKSNLVIHADCHSANKGLFAGIIILVGSVVSIILFFIAMANSAYVEIGLTVNTASELILLIIMTFSTIFAYRQLTRLDINKHSISLLDDLLLFICIPAFFLHAIFSIVPAVRKNNYLSLMTILLQVLQVLLQTPFIIDGLRRCSNTRALRHEKPGRELVTFLVVCNVALWVTETFEIKSHDKIDDPYEIYGKVLWTIISHMTLPLTMFYRFHSSVCLADIWKSAYERGE
ncbi:proton channel OtopLc [Anabrus simplex]|uniref:proton channel OtopLc n=1 Tax=Anabrus simplex TaxID=316456 RepID=UPI0035A2C2CD